MSLFLFRALPALAIAIVLLAPLGDFDTWFYVDMGRWMLEHGAFLDKELRTYTSAGAHVYNVSWLFQLLVAGVHALGGLYGLLALQAAFMFGILLLLASTAIKTREDALPFIGALVLLGSFFTIHYSLRPHLVEHIALAAVLFSLRLPARPATWLLQALILLIWANAHGSAIVGAGILAAHLVLDPSSRSALPSHGRRLFLATGMMLLPFATPMGIDILQLIANTRADNAVLTISEWTPPKPYPILLFLLFAGYLIALLTKNYAFRTAEILLILFYFYQSTQHLRFLHELAILLVLPAHFLFVKLQALIRAHWRQLTPLLLASMIFVLGTFRQPDLTHWKTFPHNYPLNIQSLPQGSASVLNVLAAKTDRPLRILNPYAWGGYLAYALGDRAQLHIDGRASMVFDRSLVQENFLAYRKDSTLLRHMADQWNVDLILTGMADSREDLTIPLNDPHWRLIGYDKTSLIYARRATSSIANNWPEIPYLPLLPLEKNLNQDQLIATIQATQALAESAPDNTWAWVQLGLLLNRQASQGKGSLEIAIDVWKLAWTRMPTPEITLHYARCLTLAEHPVDEILLLLRGLPTPLPNSPAPYLETLAAQIFLDLGMPQRSLNYLIPKDKFRLQQLEDEALTWQLRGEASYALLRTEDADSYVAKAKAYGYKADLNMVDAGR